MSHKDDDTLFWIGWTVITLFTIAIIVAAIWVAGHFITKFW